MMTNDLMLGGVYILMAMMLVLGCADGAPRAAAKLLTMALAWVAIFAAGFVLFTFRDDFGWVAQRLKAEAIGNAGRAKDAKPASRWRSTAISGSRRSSTARRSRFLVDSGATMTTIDRETAVRAGVAVSPRRDQFVRTGNGIIRVSSRPRRRASGWRDRAPATSGCRSPTMTI